jgi:hypothetical protein
MVTLDDEPLTVGSAPLENNRESATVKNSEPRDASLLQIVGVPIVEGRNDQGVLHARDDA